MDWRKGFTARYYFTVVDKRTWRDLQPYKVISGSVKRDTSSLMQSADVETEPFPDDENWIRIWLDVSQNGAQDHVALFTGLSTSPEEQTTYTKSKNSLECYSVLKPADDVLLDRGWYAPQGMKGSSLVKQLLGVGPAPIVEAEHSPVIKESIIAEDGETRLTMSEKILKAMNWRLRIDGRGVITICPKASQPSITVNALSYDVIEPEIKRSADWYDCPNVFRAVDDDMMGIARDDDPDSFLSTVSRGREIWMEETGCELNAGETIAEYALRRLKEEQSYGISSSYNRRFIPDLYPTDVIYLHYPEQRLDGYFGITSQSIDLGFGARTSEEVVKL